MGSFAQKIGSKPVKFSERIKAKSQPVQESFAPPVSPQGMQQTPTVAGTGKLNSPVLNAAESFIETATPYGSLAGLVTEPFADSGAGALKTGLRVADIGLSALPGFGLVKAGAKQAMSPLAKSMLLSSAGAGAGAATGEVLDEFGGVGPIGKAALTIAGGVAAPIGAAKAGMKGLKQAVPKTPLIRPVEPPTSPILGQLTPAQEQVRRGIQMSPEIEREAIGRSAGPMQEVAKRQGQTLENLVQGELGKVAPITSPTLAASTFQQSFEKAKETAKGLMNELNEVVKAESKGVNHDVIGVELRNAWVNRLKREGWKVSKEGKILEDVTAPGYSPQAAAAIQTFLDQAPKVKNLETLTNFKRNFGTAIEKAFQEGGNYAQGIQKRLYGATAAAGRQITPEFAQETVGKGNKAWSTMMRVEELGNMEKMLAKDPSKFYDTLLQGAASDKNFLAKMEKTLPKAGLKMQDIQSVAVSNISDKLQTALRNPARDEVDRTLGAITAIEKEYGRIPVSARKALLGDSEQVISQVIKDGQAYKEWANRLRNAPETARNMPLSIINKVANGVEFLANRGGFLGRQAGAFVGAGLRKMGTVADDAAMKKYLEGVPEAPKIPFMKKVGATAQKYSPLIRAVSQ